MLGGGSLGVSEVGSESGRVSVLTLPVGGERVAHHVVAPRKSEFLFEPFHQPTGWCSDERLSLIQIRQPRLEDWGDGYGPPTLGFRRPSNHRDLHLVQVDVGPVKTGDLGNSDAGEKSDGYESHQRFEVGEVENREQPSALGKGEEFRLGNRRLHLDTDGGVGVGESLLDAPVHELPQVTDEVFPLVDTRGFSLGVFELVLGLANQFVGEVL